MADVNGGGGAQAGQNVPSAGGTYNAGTGQYDYGVNPNQSGSGTFGQQTGFDPNYAFNAAQQDPGIAAHYLRLAAGQTRPTGTKLGQFRDDLYGKALQAYLALNGVGAGGQSGPQDMQAFLVAMQNGSLGSLLGGGIQRGLGAVPGVVDPVAAEKILRTLVALRSVNMGSLGSSLMSNDLDNMLYQQEGAGLQSNGQDNTYLGERLGTDQYGQALQQYLALR